MTQGGTIQTIHLAGNSSKGQKGAKAAAWQWLVTGLAEGRQKRKSKTGRQTGENKKAGSLQQGHTKDGLTDSRLK